MLFVGWADGNLGAEGAVHADMDLLLDVYLNFTSVLQQDSRRKHFLQS